MNETHQFNKNFKRLLKGIGVRWADSNPKSPWISVEDDLPCDHAELISSQKSSNNLKVTVYVVAAIHDFNILSRMYELDGNWYWENDEPTYWFPIPELSKNRGIEYKSSRKHKNVPAIKI